MDFNKWDRRFLDLAKHISTWSKDPSTQVGAVITQGNRIVSVGFNGQSSRMDDKQEWLDNRELKLQTIIHGEINAILFAKEPLDGATLYTYPFMPCSVCASIVSQSGISSVVTLDNVPERYRESFNLSEDTFAESGIMLNVYKTEEF
jgi:dCMP deaminase